MVKRNALHLPVQVCVHARKKVTYAHMDAKMIDAVRTAVGKSKLEVLTDIFRNSAGIPPVVRANRYRADHPEWIEVLDQMAVDQLFLSRQQRDTGNYHVRAYALPILNDEHAKTLVRLMETIYTHLRALYLERLSAPVKLCEITKRLQAEPGSPEEASIKEALYYMIDSHGLWSGVSTGFPYAEDPFIVVAEDVLKHDDFTSVLGQVYHWHILKREEDEKDKKKSDTTIEQANDGIASPPLRSPELALPTRLVVPELPQRILDTYARLWQLETWLRRLVYIELRALAGDGWEAGVRKADGPREADKRLTHMPTPETDPLSYVHFGEVRRLIGDHWRLFAPFLPPRTIWEAKLEEVAQIRHRVAHFRLGHEDDLQRVVQLLRDIDKGFWRFCTSYNDPHSVLPYSEDSVVERFLPLDLLPWQEVREREWARVGFIDPQAAFTVTVEVLLRPWAAWSIPVAGKEGMLYEITIFVRHVRHLEYDRFLKGTQSIHKHLVHICLDSAAKDIRITIPTILGSDRVIEIVDRLVEVARYCIASGEWPSYKGSIQSLADSWPEYVLGPENPLTFLSPDQPCSFFGI